MSKWLLPIIAAGALSLAGCLDFDQVADTGQAQVYAQVAGEDGAQVLTLPDDEIFSGLELVVAGPPVIVDRIVIQTRNGRRVERDVHWNTRTRTSRAIELPKPSAVHNVTVYTRSPSGRTQTDRILLRGIRR